ncbi:hypothetical protein TOPH_09293 [Tolypocladium ophioglossoides CBS 100239]|uniref:Uncharacterized protein n=1 Tax=Tolypocladium ophioglossoides (strain CBS 100239) TaxID=1163406 RepID=A0A0L0MV15_TOLOC|nr:hypothetical protein TOPH_09293 [Tolypocladium ophioglossoides CBS 100239]
MLYTGKWIADVQVPSDTSLEACEAFLEGENKERRQSNSSKIHGSTRKSRPDTGPAGVWLAL